MMRWWVAILEIAYEILKGFLEKRPDSYYYLGKEDSIERVNVFKDWDEEFLTVTGKSVYGLLNPTPEHRHGEYMDQQMLAMAMSGQQQRDLMQQHLAAQMGNQHQGLGNAYGGLLGGLGGTLGGLLGKPK